MTIVGENCLSLGKEMNDQNQTNPIPSPNYSTRDATNNTRGYHAFLLRVWRDDELSPWRIQIENPHTDEVIGFSSIAKLKFFLDEQFPAKQGENDTAI